MFLLDSDFCIDWLRRKPYARQALCLLRPTDVAVSAVTVGELLAGAFGALKPDLEARKVQAFLEPIPVLPYGRPEATHFARVTACLRQQGQLIGAADAMIAATALAHRYTVVTRNLKHFSKVDNLKVANWDVNPPLGILPDDLAPEV